MYESKRSCNLLKVKKFLDTEATVLKHLKGTGRCSAMCGAILCKLDNGIEFKIGSGFDDKQIHIAGNQAFGLFAIGLLKDIKADMTQGR